MFFADAFPKPSTSTNRRDVATGSADALHAKAFPTTSTSAIAGALHVEVVHAEALHAALHAEGRYAEALLRRRYMRRPYMLNMCFICVGVEG